MAFVDELDESRRHIGLERLACASKLTHVQCYLSVPIAVGNNRCKQVYLLSCLDDLAVRSGQVIEVTNHLLDPFLDWKRLKHVAANKSGQISYGLHRHRLQK